MVMKMLHKLISKFWSSQSRISDILGMERTRKITVKQEQAETDKSVSGGNLKIKGESKRQ